MINYKIGNIVDAFLNKEINVLIQGCNCFCGFGRGLAKEIEDRIPEAYEVDKQTSYADKNKLGTYSFYEKEKDYLVINAYTQYHWIKKLNNEPKVKKGRGYVLANYDAIRKSLNAIASDYKGLKIGLPLIGAGWANGDWKIISKIIEDELINCDYVVYVLNEAELKKIKSL